MFFWTLVQLVLLVMYESIIPDMLLKIKSPELFQKVTESLLEKGRCANLLQNQIDKTSTKFGTSPSKCAANYCLQNHPQFRKKSMECGRRRLAHTANTKGKKPVVLSILNGKVKIQTSSHP
jgi:hypothetical protein